MRNRPSSRCWPTVLLVVRCRRLRRGGRGACSRSQREQRCPQRRRDWCVAYAARPFGRRPRRAPCLALHAYAGTCSSANWLAPAPIPRPRCCRCRAAGRTRRCWTRVPHPRVDLAAERRKALQFLRCMPGGPLLLKRLIENCECRGELPTISEHRRQLPRKPGPPGVRVVGSAQVRLGRLQVAVSRRNRSANPSDLAGSDAIHGRSRHRYLNAPDARPRSLDITQIEKQSRRPCEQHDVTHAVTVNKLEGTHRFSLGLINQRRPPERGRVRQTKIRLVRMLSDGTTRVTQKLVRRTSERQPPGFRNRVPQRLLLPSSHARQCVHGGGRFRANAQRRRHSPNVH